MQRKKLLPSLESRLKEYYGGKICVVTGVGEGAGLSIHWAHLDEDPLHTTLDNIIPLSSGFNISQEEWRRNRQLGVDWFDRSVDLKATYLFFKARQHFQHGFPALAFGCSRLGQVLSLKYPREFEAYDDDVWAFFCQILFYLPYKMDSDLLISSFENLISYINSNHHCPQDLRAALLLALANFYQDCGMWNESDELYSKIETLEVLPPNVLAATYRRRAINSIFSRMKNIKSIDAFDKAYELNDVRDFRTSIAIAKAWEHLVNQNPKDALKELEEANNYLSNPKVEPIDVLSPHNVFELALTSAAVLHELGAKYESKIVAVNRLHIDSPHTRLRPVFTDHISKLTFDEQISRPISKLSTSLVLTPNLVGLLKIASTKLLEIKPSHWSGRLPWVD